MKIVKCIKENYLLFAILLLGAVLRFYKLDFQSIWLDEIHTMIECNPKITYKESYDITAFREQMPHLYFLSIKLFSTIFGHTTFVVRMFSAIIGILSVFSIYLLGREIKNPKTGIIAALLLSINYFHIWYSQEARPYALFALMAILSFYRLIIFIKKNNLKTAILYGLFAALMIDTHFFGLFILVSQVAILFFFLMDLPQKARISFLKYSLFSALTIIILWLPSLKIFLTVMKIKSFWIQPPSLEVYTQLFKEFFGNSEAIMLFVFLITAFYFIKLFNQKKKPGTSVSQNQMLFSFVVLSLWISITLFIPLVRSYLDVPMIISRYFIAVLPALIMILSIGVSQIRTQLVQKAILGFLVIASLTDIIIIKDYYGKVSKTQFREITESILKRNKNKEKVVSSFGWLMSYFLNEDDTNTALLQAPSGNNITVECSLQDYINQMKNKTIPMESFWYMDGNSKPYKLESEDEAFLNENFTLDVSVEMFDVWTKHYVSKTIQSKENQGKFFEIKNFQPINVNEKGEVCMFENSTIKSPSIYLETGNYSLKINAKSLPNPPINNENAHLIIKLGDKEIGNIYLSEKENERDKFISFVNSVNQHCKITLTYDNDLTISDLDRNLIIYSIELEKK